jgi:ketosteroid isomerase-like protein
MAGELEQVAKDLMAALDSRDLDRIVAAIGENAQSIDEITRRWIRGPGELEAHVREMVGAVSNVRSELRDVEERTWGDTGVVTGWLEQDYTLEGSPQHVSAPTTVVLRREGGEWKVAVFHSVPLPDQN